MIVRPLVPPGGRTIATFSHRHALAAGSLMALSEQMLTSTKACCRMYPEAWVQTPLVKTLRARLVVECAGSGRG